MRGGGYRTRELYVVCDKSSEAEMWQCTATVSSEWIGTSRIRNLFGRSPVYFPNLSVILTHFAGYSHVHQLGQEQPETKTWL